MKSHKKANAFSWLAAILWMFFIFYLSSQPAQVSNALSKKITISLVNITNRVQEINFISQKHVSEINNIIRQYAHALVYIVLAVLVINSLRDSGMKVTMRCLVTFLISVVFACSDEIHQMFVVGRGAQLQDLLMDCTGVLLVVLIYLLYALFNKKDKSEKTVKS